MLRLIKVILTFINGFITGILLFLSAIGFFMSWCYFKAEHNAGLELVSENGNWTFKKKIQDEDKDGSVS